MNQPRTSETTNSHYTLLSGVYEERANAHANERYRLECLKWIEPRGRVLDVGCGTTSLLKELQRDFRMVGIDASEKMLTSGQTRGYVAVSNAEYLAAEANVFDGAICINLLEHVTEPNRVLEEISRILRVGGRLVVCTPAAEWSALLDVAESLKLKLPEGPHKFLSRRELFQGVAAAALRPVLYRRILILPVGGKQLARASRFIERFTPAIGFLHLLVAERTER